MIQVLKGIVSYFKVVTISQAKRLIKIIVGLTLLIIGICMIVLPGPATVIIPLALSILAGEFMWARWLLNKFSTTVNNVFKLKSKIKK